MITCFVQPICDMNYGQAEYLELLVRDVNKDGTHSNSADAVFRKIKTAGERKKLDLIMFGQAIMLSNQIPLKMCINLSKETMEQERSADIFLEFARRYEHNRGQIVFEINEKVNTMEPAPNENIRLLVRGGYKIALDDVDERMENVQAVSQLNGIEMIKTGCGLVKHMDCENVQKLYQLIETARQNHVRLTVEGIETAEQEETICKIARMMRYQNLYLQGFVYGYPEKAGVYAEKVEKAMTC